DYVAIHPKNYAVFSNHFISMYLTICSEIDSVADEFCKNLNIGAKERFGINNKINHILTKYNNIKNWRCSTKFPNEGINFVPFAKFTDNESADWWKVYNNIKHKRTEKNGEQYNYELANLKNVLHALSALYLLLYKLRMEFSNDFPLNFESELFDISYI
ncbi:MAG: hypothetical protein MJ081_05055, partial [Ruminococcus sp.]|nr:hypothetical protein [Ruminococcus sp.]